MGRKSDYGNDIYKQLQEIMGRLDSVEKDLKTEKREHKEDVERLEKIIVSRDREIKVLKEDNERMKRILNNDSTNSSLPPSTDQKGKSANTYNTRTKSGKKSGAQAGHKGTTLTREYVEQGIRENRFAHKIKSFGTGRGKFVSRYVLDLEITATATELRFYGDETGKISIPQEYRSDVVYGPVVKALAVELYSEGVVSNDRICGFINAVSGKSLALSEGSIYGFCKKFAERAANSTEQIKNELLCAKTVGTDATVMTVNGKQGYIRNQSTKNAVLYSAMEKKNLEELKETGILSEFTGTLVHDHETALYHFGTAHGECNVHLLRYLKKNTEETGNHWSSELSELLTAMNTERKERMSVERIFTLSELDAYGTAYDELLEKGKSENKETKGRYAKQEEKTLLNRLSKYRENHLLFLRDFDVMFENNISERDLRKCRNRQKISGGFRKQSGIEMYCTIMSIVETCKRKNMQVFENICKIFNGTPAIF